MSHIEDLISHHCPNDVEQKLISDVATLERGKYISKKTAIPGDIPVIAGGRGPAYWHNESNRTGELLTVAGSGAYAGFVQYWDSPIFVSDAFSITTNPQLKSRFLYHWLKNKQDFLHSLKKGSGVPHVYPKDIAKLKIPVPPLEVQDEIVRILDSFTKLEAELGAELEARRKQYEYYRASLLSLENLTSRLGKDNVKLLPLNDVCTKVSSGGTPKRSVPGYFGGNIPWIRSTDLNFKTIGEVEGSLTESGLDNCSAKLIPAGTVLIAMAGATVAKSGITTVEATTNQNCCALEADLKQIKPKFLFHVLCNDYEVLKDKAQGTQQFLNMTRIKKHDIPVPSLAEQERIVAILDKFDALVNDLSSGLPAEIAARRKQYEYYRDRLLTFTPAK